MKSRNLQAVIERTTLWHLFTLALIVRLWWAFFSGHNAIELNKDAGWILRLMNATASGVVDYDIGRFITSPLYPFTGGLFQIALGPLWLIMLIFTQVVLASWSAAWLYKLGLLHFSKGVAVLATVIFAVHPMMFWWTGTVSSESPFQSLFIGAVYFLVMYTRSRSDSHVLFSASLFSLAWLTKSHILLFAPCIVLYLWLNRKSGKEGLVAVFSFAAICAVYSLPFGYHCLRTHDVYVISSNGMPFHFYTGNHEMAYRTIVDVPPNNSNEYRALQAFEFTPFNGPVHDSLMALPQKTKQGAYFRESVNWIRKNPTRFAELKVYNAFFFLMPGVSWRHYPVWQWLGTFILSLPFYILAYLFLIRIVRERKKEMYWLLNLFAVMSLFSIVFYVQNRFRTITLEPFYLIIAVAEWQIRRNLLALRDDGISLPSES